MPNDKGFVGTGMTVNELALPLEILANLTFLTREHSEHPERVRMYMGIAAEQLGRLREVVSSAVAAANRDQELSLL